MDLDAVLLCAMEAWAKVCVCVRMRVYVFWFMPIVCCVSWVSLLVQTSPLCLHVCYNFPSNNPPSHCLQFIEHQNLEEQFLDADVGRDGLLSSSQFMELVGKCCSCVIVRT